MINAVSHTLLAATFSVNEQGLILCGDGFMDFIHRPKSKILKIKATTFRKLALLPSSGEWWGRREELDGGFIDGG
jgi:hypothetical protein